MKVSDALVLRLIKLNTTDSLGLVRRFQAGEITEQQFVQSAHRFFEITRSDAGGALNRSVLRFAGKPIAIPEKLYVAIFGEPDRGRRVTAVGRGIREGLINPAEISNHA